MPDDQSYCCRSPVLLCAFNRPDSTAQVMESIRKVRPPALYFSCDGPRPDTSDAPDVSQVRELSRLVDWPCRLELKFPSENLGCGKAVREALEWFFSCEPAGIVLEDDTLPGSDFFRFCDGMLERYAGDESIHAVCGSTFFPPEVAGIMEGDYSFSKFFFCWGWASWSRCLKDFPGPEGGWDSRNLGVVLDGMKFTRFEQDFWKERVLRSARGEIDTWDYQFLAAGWKNGRRSIISAYNLVTNIGYGAGATHTHDPTSPFAEAPLEPLPQSELAPCQSARLEKFLDDLRFFHVYNWHWGTVTGAQYTRRAELECTAKLKYWESLAGSPLRLARHLLREFARHAIQKLKSLFQTNPPAGRK